MISRAIPLGNTHTQPRPLGVTRVYGTLESCSVVTWRLVSGRKTPGAETIACWNQSTIQNCSLCESGQLSPLCKQTVAVFEQGTSNVPTVATVTVLSVCGDYPYPYTFRFGGRNLLITLSATGENECTLLPGGTLPVGTYW